MVGKIMILLSLKSDISSFTGITSSYILETVTGVLFGVGILLIVSLLVKFLFKLL